MLTALAYVPTCDVNKAYQDLVKSEFYSNNEEDLDNLLQYFERTWVGVLSRSEKRRLQSLFKIQLWNCYDAVNNDTMRTNNAVEGWHHSFNGKVRVSHASFDKFLKVVIDEQGLTELLINQMDTGLNVVAKRRKAYRDVDERIKNIVDSYDYKNIIEYLKNIGSVMKI